MRASVDAVIVIRRGGEPLAATLRALLAQTRRPERLCFVDVSADSTVRAQVDTIVGEVENKLYLDLAFGAVWAAAIDEATEELHPGASPSEDAWLWLLRDDTVPEPRALELLALSVEAAPMVKIAGPKHRMADRPTIIRELGETLTGFGERIALAERELDQAQYDRLSDVLAVGEAGMLVHAPTLTELEGFDPALSPLDCGLDLCVRARLAGHRVVVLPRAVMDVGAGPADWFAGKDLSAARNAYLSRRAWLYRRFVYAPVWAVVPLLLWVLPWALVRALFHVVAKHPDRSVGEVTAALWALGSLGSVVSARRVLARTRTTSWAVIDSLRMSSEDVRKRRSMARETRLAAAEEAALQAPRPPIFPALPWTLLVLVVIAAITHGRWWGSTVLIGGGLLPLPGSLSELWAKAWQVTPTTISLDAPALPADPFNFVLALLGSLTWWSPSLALTGLFIAAIPLAGVSAWWALAQVVSKSWTVSLMAGLWAISPVFVIALSEGRSGAVIAHIALPWLVASLLGAHNSWQRVGQAALATLVVLASAPVLWPAVVVGYLVLAFARVWGSGLRMFFGVLPLGLAPAAILSAPRFGAWWESVSGRWWDDWGVLLADPGQPFAFVAGQWWEMALGWPTPASAALATGLPGVPAVSPWVAAVLAGPLVVLALAALAVARPVAGGAAAGLFSLGLVTAVASPVLFSGYDGVQPVFVWAGAGVSLLYLGLLIGAGSVLDRVDFADTLGNALSGPSQWLVRGGAALVAAFGLATLIPFVVSSWSGGTAPQARDSARTLPVFVAAEAATNPRIGTLVIQSVGEDYRVSLERGAGATLMDSSALVRARSTAITPRDEDLARLVSTLIRPSAASPDETLQAYGIRFILLDAATDDPAALTLQQRPELVSASAVESGQLWQVPLVSVDGASATESSGGAQGLFWFALAIAAVFALPTERRAHASSRARDDALPTLGEETSDEL